MRPLGVYVHFPWCLKKCPYCDFVSFASPKDAIDHAGYANAVLAELEARVRAGVLDGRRIQTVFFGGGTPSLWEPTELGRLPERWRPPAEEDGLDPASVQDPRPHPGLELGEDRVGIARVIDRVFRRRERDEIAIRALLQAPGEVDVDAERPHGLMRGESTAALAARPRRVTKPREGSGRPEGRKGRAFASVARS